MTKLILSFDGAVIKELTLTKERTLIGRKPHNDLVIDNLAVSGEHAVIVTILKDSFLEDLGSTNGTFVNGQPIKKHFLQHSDVIELGKYKLKYIDDGSSVDLSATSSGFDQTMSDFSAPRGEPAEAQSAVAIAAVQDLGQTSSMLSLSPQTAIDPHQATLRVGSDDFDSDSTLPQAVIQVRNGVNAGRELRLTKALTTLGRSGVQVAVITRRPHGFFITHVEGNRHPLVNGETIDEQPRLLADQDVIEISGTQMEFVLVQVGLGVNLPSRIAPLV